MQIRGRRVYLLGSVHFVLNPLPRLASVLDVSCSRSSHQSLPGFLKDFQTPRGALAEPCGPCHVSALSSNCSGERLKSSELSSPPWTCSSRGLGRDPHSYMWAANSWDLLHLVPRIRSQYASLLLHLQRAAILFSGPKTVLLAPTQQMKLPCC